MLTILAIIAASAIAIDATMAYADRRYEARNAPRRTNQPRTDNNAHKFTPRRG